MPAMKRALRSDPGRWLSIGLRSLHLVGVALLGAALLGAPLSSRIGGGVMFASGLVLFVADHMAARIDVRELAGLWIVAKLATVGWMLWHPPHAPALFFVLLVGSSVFSHAPRDLRHWSPLARRRAPPGLTRD